MIEFDRYIAICNITVTRKNLPKAADNQQELLCLIVAISFATLCKRNNIKGTQLESREWPNGTSQIFSVKVSSTHDQAFSMHSKRPLPTCQLKDESRMEG